MHVPLTRPNTRISESKFLTVPNVIVYHYEKPCQELKLSALSRPDIVGPLFVIKIQNERRRFKCTNAVWILAGGLKVMSRSGCRRQTSTYTELLLCTHRPALGKKIQYHGVDAR